MNYSLGNMLSGGMIGGIDPSAKGYIAAVTAAGATVTSSQRTFINNFYKSAKSDYYTNLKRLYLPIWGVAAANAIDMIGLTSGTFIGSVTHGAGYVQGNGTTGAFRSDLSPDTAGRSASTGLDFILISQANTNSNAYLMGGTSNSFARRNGFLSQTSAITCLANSTLTGASSSLAIASQNGLFVSSRTSSTLLSFFQRKTSGLSTLATSVVVETTAAPTTLAVFMARSENSDVAISSVSNAQNGLYGFGLGITNASAGALSLDLKNLWEGCTGLTLP